MGYPPRIPLRSYTRFQPSTRNPLEVIISLSRYIVRDINGFVCLTTIFHYSTLYPDTFHLFLRDPRHQKMPLAMTPLLLNVPHLYSTTSEHFFRTVRTVPPMSSSIQLPFIFHSILTVFHSHSSQVPLSKPLQRVSLLLAGARASKAFVYGNISLLLHQQRSNTTANANIVQLKLAIIRIELSMVIGDY